MSMPDLAMIVDVVDERNHVIGRTERRLLFRDKKTKEIIVCDWDLYADTYGRVVRTCDDENQDGVLISSYVEDNELEAFIQIGDTEYELSSKI